MGGSKSYHNLNHITIKLTWTDECGLRQIDNVTMVFLRGIHGALGEVAGGSNKQENAGYHVGTGSNPAHSLLRHAHVMRPNIKS